MTMRLTEHFSLEELTASDTAARLGIDNTPSAEILATLKATAQRMEHVRLILGHPIEVTSGYRCAAVNRAIGSKDTSAHVLGHAVDFRCPGFGTPLAVARALAGYVDELEFDQLIHEFRRWVHISFHPHARRQRLTIDERGTRVGIE